MKENSKQESESEVLGSANLETNENNDGNEQ
jgi:hypothetical protein